MNPAAATIPSASQLDALRKIYGPVEAAKRLDRLFGYSENLAQVGHQPLEGRGRAALGLEARKYVEDAAGLDIIKGLATESGFIEPPELAQALGLTPEEVADTSTEFFGRVMPSYTHDGARLLWTRYCANRTAILSQLDTWRANHPANDPKKS